MIRAEVTPLGIEIHDWEQIETFSCSLLAASVAAMEVTNGHVILHANNVTLSYVICGFEEQNEAVYCKGLLTEVGDGALAGVIPIRRHETDGTTEETDAAS